MIRRHRFAEPWPKSPPTLSRAIGFSGFRQFQITFAQALAVKGEREGAAATGIALRAGKPVEGNLRRLKARLQFKRLPREPSPE